mgnify:CR=1 FL=1
MAVGFFRPEAVAAVMRWREVLVGVGLAVLGLWWILGPGDLLALVGAGLVLIAGGLILIGLWGAAAMSHYGDVPAALAAGPARVACVVDTGQRGGGGRAV